MLILDGVFYATNDKFYTWCQADRFRSPVQSPQIANDESVIESQSPMSENGDKLASSGDNVEWDVESASTHTEAALSFAPAQVAALDVAPPPVIATAEVTEV